MMCLELACRNASVDEGPTLQVNFLESLLLEVSRMLPPDRSPCRMLMLCRYASALAISRAVYL